MRSTVRYLALLLLGGASVLAAAGSATLGPIAARAIVGVHMVERFEEEFGLEVRSPPVCYNEELGLWVSALYIGNTVYEMTYYGGPASAIGRSYTVLRPQGTLRVLSVGIDYRNTSLASEFSTEWVSAQESINGDHERYATSIGLPAPIIQYESTNVVISSNRVQHVNLRNRAEVRDLLIGMGHDPDSYDIVAVLDLDPSNQSGGLHLGGQFIYLGWYFYPRSGEVDVSPSEWIALARSTYHHEIGHVHGWQHHWPKDPEVDYNLITCPALYGWTDTDGDGVIEIQDSTPYGMP